ncbi:uncharacterized protein N7446_007809 [Penicillium canescens]|uniref:Major facilitator superfamily (MFS) profile domain-containing protein n=1 Tax=Penicillium canescens TaxID=5083 RepID=A0AAD6IMQ3_PENCN|nr:uncharacterized protein N7446_007809 [Penicillium canescens]KAJ6033896.1 hypothetical protein N7444_011667 [Penicillium canescens]KAJ6056916.1 hypothetical protein N7460_000190 [Penicillium canescens]KAJ6058226.1 hypothetical protein N7446_007809 [Penicillium canescens]
MANIGGSNAVSSAQGSQISDSPTTVDDRLDEHKETSTQSIDHSENITQSPTSLPKPPDESNATPVGFGKDGCQSDSQEYPNSWRLAAIMIGVCLAVFSMALDNTILATAIPKITDQFTSLGDVGWYGSVYPLTNCCLTLVFGKLYTFYSTKWVYLSALAVFEIGSLICGATPSSLGLIIGRAIAGLGSSGIYLGSMIILSQSVPLQKRPLFTSLVGGLYGVAGVAGPLLGGAFTDYVSWRWCFYINPLFGAVTALFILLFFDGKEPIKSPGKIKEQISQFDLIGLFFFLPGMISLLLALQWGGQQYNWQSGRIIGLFVCSICLLSIFIVVQWRQKEKATVTLRMIKNKNVWGASLFNFCITGSFLVFSYYLPVWFQSIKNVSATKSGLMNLPMLLGVILCSIISGYGVGRIGYYTPFMYAAPIVSAIGAGLLSTFQANFGPSQWIGYQALYGIGLGLGLSQPIVVIQAAIPLIDIPSAIAIVTFIQSLGVPSQNVFRNELLRGLAQNAPKVDAHKLITAGPTTLRYVVPAELLERVLVAYNSAITHAFYVGAAFSVLAMIGALPIQWISVKGRE